MEDIQRPIPKTVDEVFNDFKGRRSGLIKAFTTDVDKFYQQCDPEEGNLCLYGLPNETWEVRMPDEEVPPELPEPALGINFARDGMPKKDWLSRVAVHCDSWLIAVAFCFVAHSGFGKTEREGLFQMINNLPTLFEVVTETVGQPIDEKLVDEVFTETVGQPIDEKLVDEVFNDFKGRRSGLIKALTTDVDKFYQKCDPEKANLCLYGLPNETWEVNMPEEQVPPELPEPALGINFARDALQEGWLSKVAVHSDSWLLAVAFYAGFGFGKNQRERLFKRINELPTLFEVVKTRGVHAMVT